MKGILNYFYILFLFVLAACNTTTVIDEKNSTCYLHQNEITIKNQDSIIDILKQELNDSEIRKNYNVLITQMVNTINETKSKEDKIYPYHPVDSAIVFKNSLGKWPGKFQRYKCLNKYQFDLLAKFLNNPLYFIWGECGTPDDLYRIDLYDKDIVISSVTISCDNGFIECNPPNILSKFGGVGAEGTKIINRILE